MASANDLYGNYLNNLKLDVSKLSGLNQDQQLAYVNQQAQKGAGYGDIKSLYTNSTVPGMGGAAGEGRMNDEVKAWLQANANPQQILQSQQVNATNQFNKNLPQAQQQMASTLSRMASQQTNAQNRNINTYNSSRGLAYGGINKGEQAANAGANAANLASNITNANNQLTNVGQQMTNATIGTGLGIQGQLQQQQDLIYQQALAQQNAQNSIIGSVLGTGLLAGTIYATGGFGGAAAKG